MQRTVEELTLNGWPCLQTVLYDGWVLRFADGYTRRANSANPLYASTLPLKEKVARCEDEYWGRGLNTVFKLTAASEPAGLDAFLDAHGYAAEATSSVQIADLTGLDRAPDPAVEIAERLPAGWVEEVCAAGGSSTRHAGTMAATLERIAPRAGFARLRVDGATAAVGLAVVERGYVGLFDIATLQAQRGRGLGTRLVGELLRWGREHGAHTGHLAVQCGNTPAEQLYAKLGFREVYRYWYRVKPPPAS
jgi:GNAT superfamily N-acetyltransferase